MHSRISRAGLLVVAGLAPITLFACSSTPQALEVPACSLLSPAQARLSLASPNVQAVASRPGYCTETGTGAGSRVSSLTIRIYEGSDASTVPPGVTGSTFPPEPVFYSPGGTQSVEAYAIPVAPSAAGAQQGLHAFMLSASKDGCVIRVTAGGLSDALGGARLALEGVLPHV
jgi:hypothetical protein